MRKTTYSIFGIICLTLLCSCEGLKEQTLDPFYLELGEIEVKTASNQGAATHNIRDAWVLTKERELGPFELPVTLPVLSEASVTEFSIFPGIRDNGQAGLPIIYPFIKPHEFSLTATPGEVYPETLVFEYYDDIVFEFNEDFEGSHVFTLDSDDFSESELTIVGDSEQSGNNVAKIYVNEANPVCEVISASTFSPADFTGTTYLEIDYKSEVPLVIGIQKNLFNGTQKEYIIILKPKEEYNKLYLNMTSHLSDPEISQFSLILNVDMTGLSIDEGEVLIDNIKLLHL